MNTDEFKENCTVLEFEQVKLKTNPSYTMIREVTTGCCPILAVTNLCSKGSKLLGYSNSCARGIGVRELGMTHRLVDSILPAADGLCGKSDSWRRFFLEIAKPVPKKKKKLVTAAEPEIDPDTGRI